jgi:hypothetical protein
MAYGYELVCRSQPEGLRTRQTKTMDVSQPQQAVRNIPSS